MCENVCIVGPCEAGKTRLWCKLTGRRMPDGYSPTIEDAAACPQYRMQLFDTAGTDSPVPGIENVRESSIAVSRFFIVVMPPRTTTTSEWAKKLSAAIIEIQRLRYDDFHFILVLGGAELEWVCPAAFTRHLIAVVPLDSKWTPFVCIQAIRACADNPLSREPSPSPPTSSASTSPVKERPTRPERGTSFRRLSQHFLTSIRITQTGLDQ